VIATLYPDPCSTVRPEPVADTAVPKLPPQLVTHRGRPLAVQAMNIPLLMQLARAVDGRIEVLVSVGDTVMESTPLLRVDGASGPLPDAMLFRAIERGAERTFAQDPKYAIRLLVDIAIRALSPAINDPTTAVQALDQIGDLLLRLGRRRLEEGVFPDAYGIVRVIVPFPSWDDFLRLAFDEIRTYGGSSVQVMRRMNALIRDLTALVPAERRDALTGWAARLDRTVDEHFADPDEHAAASVEDRQGLGSSRRPAA